MSVDLVYFLKGCMELVFWPFVGSGRVDVMGTKSCHVSRAVLRDEDLVLVSLILVLFLGIPHFCIDTIQDVIEPVGCEQKIDIVGDCWRFGEHDHDDPGPVFVSAVVGNLVIS